MDAIRTLFTLQWTQQPKFHPLPDTISRSWVHTRNGDLELLVASPASSSSRTTSAPVIFIHGGAGHAAVWLEWMAYLTTCYSAATYAFSIRCHGASYAVPYLKMTWGTSLDDLASDLEACIEEVRKREGVWPIIVAHSSGGGLTQYALHKGLVKARALVLVGSVPHWGNMQVYWNWFRRIDPWFGPRALFHLYHPNSPLSTPRLVYNAFFGTDYSIRNVPEFMKWMSNYEAMYWPLGMAGKGWGLSNRSWLRPMDILRNLELESGGDKVAVIIGSEDKMMQGTQERIVREYRQGIQQLRESKKADVELEEGTVGKSLQISKVILEGAGGGVRLVEVEGAGHHTQNDVQWKETVEALRRFCEQA
jgi:pimeloyl-ACP methyl ester carboxylesterase